MGVHPVQVVDICDVLICPVRVSPGVCTDALQLQDLMWHIHRARPCRISPKKSFPEHCEHSFDDLHTEK